MKIRKGTKAKSIVVNKTGKSIMDAVVAKPKVGKHKSLLTNKYLK
jgi:hypothetical protein